MSSTKRKRVLIGLVLCFIGIIVSAFVLLANEVSTIDVVSFIFNPLTLSFVILYIPLALLFSEMLQKEGEKCL